MSSLQNVKLPIETVQVIDSLSSVTEEQVSVTHEVSKISETNIPKTTHSEVSKLTFITVKRLSEVKESVLNDAVKVYQMAFSKEPYCEQFSYENVISAFEYILNKNGDLIFGVDENTTRSLAGGYKADEQTYFIEELAVDPKMQRLGYGRQTLSHLLDMIKSQKHAREEIRTSAINIKALNLYERFSFVQEMGLEAVAQMRQNGKISLDERVYLSKPPLSTEERLMKLKRLAVAYPSGNTTAVVFDQLLKVDPPIDRKALNQSIMSSWKSKMADHPEIEQCCFVTIPHNKEAIARVEMFGGEFCGNATRSAVWLVTEGKDYKGLIEVSGTSQALEFEVSKGDVQVQMPLPKKENLFQSVEEGALVFLDGITHLVVTDSSIAKNPRELFERLISSNKYQIKDYPAFGVSFYDMESKKADFCVWVNSIDTVFDETACGSGTCSIGIALATLSNRSIQQEVIQPSGEAIQTIVDFDDSQSKVLKSFIKGSVKVMYNDEYAFSI